MEERKYMISVYNIESLGYSQKAIELWEEAGIQYKDGSWDEFEKEGSFPNVQVLIVRLKRKIDSKVLDKFPDLKIVVSATTGHDHLDLDEFDTRGVQLISLRKHKEFLKTIPSTAEHTWALLMSVIRNIPAAHSHVVAGGWDRDLFRGYQLKNKTLGIVGYGRTGQKIASYAKAFEMNIEFYDPHVEGDDIASKVDSLEEVMRNADILSYHVHLSDDTKHMLNHDNVSLLKKGVILLNTSRGLIWDEKCVVASFEENRINGIAVDVLASELEDSKESPLLQAAKKNNNIIITPHIAGATWDAMWDCEEFIAKKTIEWI